MEVPKNTVACVCVQRLKSLKKFLEYSGIEFKFDDDCAYNFIPIIHKHDREFFIKNENGLDVYRDAMNIRDVYLNNPDILREALKYVYVDTVMDS